MRTAFTIIKQIFAQYSIISEAEEADFDSKRRRFEDDNDQAWT